MLSKLVDKPEAKKATASFHPESSAVSRQAHIEHPVASVLPRFLQPKLTINAPGDVYEQEADRVAGEVLQIPEQRHAASVAGVPAGLQRKCECGGTCAECQTEEQDEIVPRLQMKSAAPGSAGL